MVSFDPELKNRQQLWRWLALSIVSLSIAGFFAILVVLSRAPVTSEIVPWPLNFFQKGLISHVALSFIVWFFSIFGALNIYLLPVRGPTINLRIEQLSLALTCMGFIGIFVSPFRDSGEPSLNNYIPVIIDPIYYTGISLLFLGILLSFCRVVFCLVTVQQENPCELPSLVSAGSLFVIALVIIGLTANQLMGKPLNYDYNENLFWGGGHILQVFNIALFLVAISLLYRQAFNKVFMSSNWFKTINVMLILIGVLGLSFFFLFDVGTTTHTSAYTNLQYVLGVPVLMILTNLVVGLWNERKNFGNHIPASLSLISGLLVFSIGMVLGLFVDGTSTRTPAHYHGVIGGMNILFIGLFYVRFLPTLGYNITVTKVLLTQIIVYTIGQSLFVVGMFFTGSLGASRKIMGTGIDVENKYAIIATLVKDLGGAMAIIGGIIFVIFTLKALFTDTAHVQ